MPVDHQNKFNDKDLSSKDALAINAGNMYDDELRHTDEDDNVKSNNNDNDGVEMDEDENEVDDDDDGDYGDAYDYEDNDYDNASQHHNKIKSKEPRFMHENNKTIDDSDIETESIESVLQDEDPDDPEWCEPIDRS